MHESNSLIYKRFIFSSAFISIFALLSRILGYFRDIIILNWAGIGVITDAYVLSVKFPSLFRKIVSDGSMNNMLIPMLKDLKVHNKDFKKFLMLLAIKFSKYIIAVIFIFALFIKYGTIFVFSNLPCKTSEYFIQFSYFILPCLLFMGLSSIFTSALNFNKKFVVCSISNVICNIIAIIILLLGYKLNLSFGLIGLAILSGNIVQFIWVIMQAYKNDLLYMQFDTICKRITNPFSAPKIHDDTSILKNEIHDIEIPNNEYKIEFEIFKRKFMSISFSSGIAQIMMMFSSWFASFLPIGNISYLAFADRVMQVPLSIIGLIFSTTFLIYLTQYIKEHKIDNAKKLYDKVYKYALFGSAFISLLIFSFSLPICKMLFFRGKMTLTDTIYISSYLKIYILSVPAYTLSKIINTVFFAYGNTKIPLQGAIVQLVSNLILMPTLFCMNMGSLGLSIPFLSSAWIYVLYLYINMNKQCLLRRSQENH